tara:strand:+ start:34 stop:228 length:195 start_codon:yes stop_codon:yes gene_type:complete
MVLSTPQPSVDKPVPTSRKLSELKSWALEFCREETKLEEINALYEWFDAYHKRQFMPNKDALIL